MPNTYEYTVRVNQNLVDVALQHYGTEAGVQLLVLDNPAVTLARPYVAPGQSLVIRRRATLHGSPFVNLAVLDALVAEGAVVANLNPKPGGIGYMQIENDFIVS